MDRGAWQATVHGVPKSWTRLRNEPHTRGEWVAENSTPRIALRAKVAGDTENKARRGSRPRERLSTQTTAELRVEGTMLVLGPQRLQG